MTLVAKTLDRRTLPWKRSGCEPVLAHRPQEIEGERKAGPLADDRIEVAAGTKCSLLLAVGLIHSVHDFRWTEN